MSLHLLIVTLLAACVVGVIDFGLAQERPAEQLITVLGEIRKIVDGEKFEGNRSKALAEVAEVQARAGLQEEAEKTFGDFVVSLQGRSLGRGQDSTSIKIELLLRMAIAADKAGDHAAAIQYLNRAFVLTKGRIFQRAQLLDFSLILTEEVEFERVLETAFENRS